MKVVFLMNEYGLHNHLISTYVAQCPEHEVSIVKIPLVVKGKSRLETGKKILPALSGRFIAEKSLEFLILTGITWTPKLLSRGEVFRRLSWLARRHNLEYLETPSILSPECLNFLRSKRPDFIVTLMHQIVRGELLQLARHGIVNIHPGLLPRFRGIQPYFWALSEGAKMTGATLHLIEDEGIDSGRILSSAAFIVPPRCSVSLAYYLTARSAGNVLAETLQRYSEGRITPRVQDSNEGQYYRWPDKAAFKKLWARGHSLLSLRDILAIIHGDYDRFEPDERSFC